MSFVILIFTIAIFVFLVSLGKVMIQ